MAESQTVNIISYPEKSTDTDNKSQSYMDKSSDTSKFANIFDDINKTYSDKKNMQSSDEDKNNINSDTKTEETYKQTDNHIDNNASDIQIKTDTPDKSDAASDELSDDDASKEIIDDKTETKNVEYTSESKEQKNMQMLSTNNEKIIFESKTNVEIPVDSNETAESKTILNTKENVDAEGSKVLPIDFKAIISSLFSNKSKKTSDEKNSETDSLAKNNNQNVPSDIRNSLAGAVILSKNDTEIDTTVENSGLLNTILNTETAGNNIIQNSDNNEGNSDLINKILVQQSLAPKYDIQQQNTDSQIVKGSSQSDNSSLIKMEAPVVEVAEDSVVSDLDITDTNLEKDTKNILSKTSLNQEILDKTNAKVVSVENPASSNSDSNFKNLLNGQNAQEQAVKLTIENNNIIKPDSNNADLITVIDTTAQASTLTKIADGVQVQQPTQSQPQISKELSQNDILYQINKQIDVKNSQDASATKITIVLRPENLGKINLELINSNQGLTAQMTTNNAQVKEILDKNLESLKDSLGNNGVNVNNVTVKVEATQKQSNENLLLFDGNQMNSQNQEYSNSSNKGDSSTHSSLKEEVLTMESNISDEDENLISSSLHNGQIDYKV